MATTKTLRVELEAGVGQFAKGFDRAGTAVDGLGKKLQGFDGKAAKSMEGLTTRAGALADSLGRVSTTLARSADVFGLPAQALKAIDDAADVAELGLNNVSKAAVGFNTASLGAAGAGLAIGTLIGTWLRDIPQVAAAADRAADSLVRMFSTGPTMQQATAGLKEWQAEMQRAADNVRATEIRVSGGFDAWVKGAIEARDKTRDLKDASDLMQRNITNIDEARAILKVRDDTNEAAAAQKRLAAEAAATAKRMREEYQRAMESLQKDFRDAERAAQKLGHADPNAGILPELKPGASFAELREQSFVVNANLQRMAEAGAAAGLSAEQLRVRLLAAGAAAEDVDGIIQTLAIHTEDLSVSFGDSLSGALAELPQVLQSAFQGGGDVLKSVGSLFGSKIFGKDSALTKGLTKGLSGLLGGAGGILGSAIPGLGTLLGSVVGDFAGKALGKVGGAIKGLFGKGEVGKVNDLRDAFFEAHGGFKALSETLAKTGNAGLVKKIFDAKTVEEFNRLIEETKGALDLETTAQEALTDALDRYNFSAAERGPIERQRELEGQAVQLIKDFRILTASGIGADVVLSKMGGSVSEFVNESVAAGQALPMAMKPMIEQLIASGQLLDENGEAFTSVEDAGISFTETLTEGLSRAITSIDRLVAALERAAGITLPSVPEPSRSGTDVGATGGGSQSLGELPGFAGGSHGLRNFGDRTLAWLHGREAVVTEPEFRRMGTSTTVNYYQSFNENPLQNYQDREQQRAFTLRNVREANRDLAGQIDNGEA